MRADAAQLQQLIMNLVMNASDAIGKRKGVITLTTDIMQVDDEETIRESAAMILSEMGF